MKVFVTGADGFIGSHLIEALVMQGHEVTAFVMYNSFNKWGWLDFCSPVIKGHFSVIPGDVRDAYSVRSAMRNADVVIHLAALIAIPYSYIAPEAYVDTNIKGTLNILQAARELGVELVVHASTSEVYGSALRVPIDESHPLQGQSPYSATKIAADQLALSFFTSFNLPVIIIRPFNTYGPRQSLRAVIPSIIAQIAGGSRAIELGSITPTRDFSYVSDTVAGFIAPLESMNNFGSVVNLGSGFEITILDTVNLIANIMGVDVEITSSPNRVRPELSEVNRLWSDNSRAKELLGWQPMLGGIDGFREGLIKTVNWFSEDSNLSQYKEFSSYTV